MLLLEVAGSFINVSMAFRYGVFVGEMSVNACIGNLYKSMITPGAYGYFSR